MHANLLAQSDHISGEELRAKGTIAVTIAAVRVEEMEHIDPKKRGQKKPKGIVTFKELGAKPWVTNKTNVEILKTIFGEGRCGKAGNAKEHADGKCYQTDHWIGHKIALGATVQPLGADKADGVIVTGCDALSEPMVVTVKLRSKTPRDYTVNPPTKPKAAAQTDAATSGEVQP